MTKPAALDTLRGMAKMGVPTAYGLCTHEGECTSCPRKLKARDPWRAEWCLREDLHGNVWMIGAVEVGFAGRGYCFANWEKLLDEIEVPMLKRKQDATGFYWVEATDADTQAQLKEIRTWRPPSSTRTRRSQFAGSCAPAVAGASKGVSSQTRTQAMDWATAASSS